MSGGDTFILAVVSSHLWHLKLIEQCLQARWFPLMLPFDVLKIDRNLTEPLVCFTEPLYFWQNLPQLWQNLSTVWQKLPYLWQNIFQGWQNLIRVGLTETLVWQKITVWQNLKSDIFSVKHRAICHKPSYILLMASE